MASIPIPKDICLLDATIMSRRALIRTVSLEVSSRRMSCKHLGDPVCTSSDHGYKSTPSNLSRID